MSRRWNNPVTAVGGQFRKFILQRRPAFLCVLQRGNDHQRAVAQRDESAGLLHSARCCRELVALAAGHAGRGPKHALFDGRFTGQAVERVSVEEPSPPKTGQGWEQRRDTTKDVIESRIGGQRELAWV